MRRWFGEDLRGVLRRQVEHVSDRKPRVSHLERRRLEPRSAARLARRDDVRQKRHLRDDRPLTFAHGAPAPAHLARLRALRRRRIEREARRGVPARFRVGERREELAHVVPDSEKGRRHRSRRAADGRLVDGKGASHRLVPLERPVRSGLRPHEVQCAAQRRVEHLPHQRRLARAAHPGDDAHAPDRYTKRYVLEIVRPCAGELDPGVCHRSPRAYDPPGLLERPRRGGIRIRKDVRCGPLGCNVSTVPAAGGAEVDDVVGSADRLRVVLDDQHGRPHVRELPQVREQATRVPRVQADRRFVEDVERPRQPAP